MDLVTNTSKTRVRMEKQNKAITMEERKNALVARTLKKLGDDKNAVLQSGSILVI